MSATQISWCAACIDTMKTTRQAPLDSVTTIEGTALCLEHAKDWLYIATSVIGVKP